MECISARKELGYTAYSNVEELMLNYGYDEQMINDFISKSKSHSADDCPAQ